MTIDGVVDLIHLLVKDCSFAGLAQIHHDFSPLLLHAHQLGHVINTGRLHCQSVII